MLEVHIQSIKFENTYSCCHCLTVSHCISFHTVKLSQFIPEVFTSLYVYEHGLGISSSPEYCSSQPYNASDHQFLYDILISFSVAFQLDVIYKCYQHTTFCAKIFSETPHRTKPCRAALQFLVFSMTDISSFSTTYSCFQPFITLISFHFLLSFNVSCHSVSYSLKS